MKKSNIIIPKTLLILCSLLILFTQVISVSAQSATGCTNQSTGHNGFGAKIQECNGVRTARYTLGGLEITPSNYKEQFELYFKSGSACPGKSNSKASKPKIDIILGQTCIAEGKQPKVTINGTEVTYEQYALAYFSLFFDYHPDKVAPKAPEPTKDIPRTKPETPKPAKAVSPELPPTTTAITNNIVTPLQSTTTNTSDVNNKPSSGNQSLHEKQDKEESTTSERQVNNNADQLQKSFIRSLWEDFLKIITFW